MSASNASSDLEFAVGRRGRVGARVAAGRCRGRRGPLGVVWGLALLVVGSNACDAPPRKATPAVGAGPARVEVVTGVGVHGGGARFALKRVRESGPADVEVEFGSGQGEWPLSGDWDGDGFDTIGVFRSATSSFHLRSSLTSGEADRRVAFGEPRMAPIPVVGDWDGDGVDTFGVYARADSSFHLTDGRSTSPVRRRVLFGPPRAHWWPIAGDWDGDGRDGIGLYDPQTSVFHLANGLDGGVADETFVFGVGGSGALPVVGDWLGDEHDRVGLYEPDTGRFRLRHTLTAGPADETFVVSSVPPGGRPLAGRWRLLAAGTAGDGAGPDTE